MVMNEDNAGNKDSAGVKVPPPFVFLGGLAAGFVLEALIGSSVPDAVQWVAGGIALLAGIALQTTFISAFNRRGTAVAPWKPTTAIVTTGPYRFTRYPAYLGM